MTDFTDEDVNKMVDFLADYEPGDDLRLLAHHVLAAVLPEYRARVLREAADEWAWMRRGNNTPDGEAWLRARADVEGGK